MTFILAVVLLTSEHVGTDLPPPRCPALLHVLSTDLMVLAIGAELMDEREQFDLDIVRARLTSDLPRTGELARFPDPTKPIALNRTFHKWLSERLPVDLIHAEDIRGGLADCDRRYAAWYALRDAWAEHHYVFSRRENLATLRRLIGDEAFYSGAMPSPIPGR